MNISNDQSKIIESIREKAVQNHAEGMSEFDAIAAALKDDLEFCSFMMRPEVVSEYAGAIVNNQAARFAETVLAKTA